jgi:hypothetical protein
MAKGVNIALWLPAGVPWLNEINGLRCPTGRNRAIERQMLFPAVANRNSHLRFAN